MSKVLMAHNTKKSTLSSPPNTMTTTTEMSMMPSKKVTSSSNGFVASDRLSCGGGDADTNSIDFDDFTSSSSILEFLSREQECCNDEDTESIFQEVSRLADNSDTRSVDEILREAELLIQKQTYLDSMVGVAKAHFKPKINGSTDDLLTHTKTKNIIKMNTKYTRKIENVTAAAADSALKGNDAFSHPLSSVSKTSHPTEVARSTSQSSLSAATTPQSASHNGAAGSDCNHFTAFVENLPSESVISEESTPKDLQTYTATEKQFAHDDDDTDDGTDTMEEITEGIATIELLVNDGTCYKTTSTTSAASTIAAAATKAVASTTFNGNANSYNNNNNSAVTRAQHTKSAFSTTRLTTTSETSLLQQLASPMRRAPLNFNATQACSPIDVRRNSVTRRDSTQTPDSGISSHTQSTQTPRSDEADTLASSAHPPASSSSSSYCNKSTNFSPKHVVTTATSPIESISAITREHALKQDIELLQEKLKDTEERLQSLRIQHDSLSQLHRDLRESSAQQQEESEMLKLDVQHLNECANLLRSELQASRNDRSEALELQKVLQAELEESRQEKKRAQELLEKDSKTIQDLQRQCREMERILMRKHPDSVSALIVASKNPGKMSNNDQENVNSRKLLEQRIAQLEADAKEQDKKAQQILANVQARFNSVQSKYETHIADLETQVLSLQEINTKLNEKIESQVRTLDYFVTRKAEQYYNNSTQTDPVCLLDDVRHTSSSSLQQNSSKQPNCSNTAIATQTTKTSTRDHSTNTIALAPPTAATNSHPHSASSSTSSTANSTPNNSRPNSKQSGIRKPMPTVMGTLSSALASKLPVSRSDSTISLTSHAKEDAHLLATVRGMRVDLAIKDKAMQRLSRELDECKKTIRKLQKDAAKLDKPTSMSRRGYDATNYAAHDQKPGGTESQALKEAQNKIKLLEADYKSLHDKRLQDLKTLQSSHERELSSCHETVRILQQRLNERDEAFAMQKRRKVPVDYYALKAKVSSLERRHSEREERLHMLVEALSKGRLNGALEDLLSDNNNA